MKTLNNLSDIITLVTNYGFQLEKGYETDIISYYINYEKCTVARIWKDNELNRFKIYYEEPIYHLGFCDDIEFETYLKIIIHIKKKEKRQKKLTDIKKDF